MEWWRKVVFPVKRAWVAVTARVKSRKAGHGIRELHSDVLTCEYQDMQVMWEMLRQTELEHAPASSHRGGSFWRASALQAPPNEGLH